jgi:hypothetical protein
LLREGLGGAIQSPPFPFDNQPVNASLSWMESLIACAQVALLFLGMRLGVRAGRPWSSALCFCCLSASIASVWAISNISKPLYGHLCVWAAILGMASWLAIWASCAAWLYGKAGRRLPARAIAAVEICAIVPLACLSIATVKEHYAPRPVSIAAETAAAPAKSRLQLESEAAEELAAALSDFIHANSIQRPLIQIHTPASASMAAGLCLRLARQDIPFAVGLAHLHEYAPRRAPNGNEDIEIVLIDQSLRAAFDARWSYRFIASSGEFSAYSHPTLP